MSTVLNVKINEDLKRDAQATAKAVGLPMSTVVAAGLREFVRKRTIKLSDEPQIRPEVEKELFRLSKNAREGQNLAPVFDSLEESLRGKDAQ